MSGLKEQFQRFYAPGEEEIDKVLRVGLVVVDTNVLLSLYRFQSKARDELLLVLKQLGDRLWIPHQVGLEFHQNRFAVIAGQENFFAKTRDELQKSANEYIQKFHAFCNRIAVTQDEVRKLVKGIEGAHKAIANEVSRAENINEVHLDNRDSDDILRRLEALFANKVGDPMDADQ